MILTEEDKAVLAHVVADPVAWFNHAMLTVGESAVGAKVDKYRAEYLAQKDLPGYQTRAEREA